MNGIDVSAYQPTNITNIVDYDFVIIKATEGTWYVSASCDQQYELAKAKGKLLGVYHFASGTDPVAEADFFVNNIQGYLGEAVLVLDWEANAIPKGADFVRAFVRRVYDRTKVHPMIYGSQSHLQEKGIVQTASEENCAIWCAAYPSNDTTGYYAAPQLLGSVIRQYSSKGRLNGYGGNLDLDYSILTADLWNKYVLGDRNGNVEVPVVPPKPLKKTNDQIATEVMRGAWGNGEDRKARLAAAGYDYNAIQEIINSKYVRKTNDELATEVIDGKWGIGDDRKARLTGQGYDYVAIQKIVNDRLNAPAVSNELFIVIPGGSWLSQIAAQYGTSVAQLVVWNKPKYPSMTANYIQAGWTIKVR